MTRPTGYHAQDSHARGQVIVMVAIGMVALIALVILFGPLMRNSARSKGDS